MAVLRILVVALLVFSGIVSSAKNTDNESSLVKLLQSVKNSRDSKRLRGKHIHDRNKLKEKVASFETNINEAESSNYRTEFSSPAQIANEIEEIPGKFDAPSFESSVRPFQKRRRQHRLGSLGSKLLHIDEIDERGSAREVKKNADGVILGNPRPTAAPNRDLESFINLRLNALAGSKLHDWKDQDMSLGNSNKLLNSLHRFGSKDDGERRLADESQLTADIAASRNSDHSPFESSSQSNSAAQIVGDESIGSATGRSEHESVLQDDIEHTDKLISKFLAKGDEDLLDLPQLRHKLEPESSQQLSVQEEERLLKRLAFLKHQLRDRQRLARIREDRKIRQEEGTPSITANELQPYREAHPRLEMHRIDQNLNGISEASAAGGGRTGEAPNDAVNRLENSNKVEGYEAATQLQPKLLMKNITEKIDTGLVRAPINRALFAFSYDLESPLGPKMWRILNPEEWTCQGRKQSPINIELSKVVKDQTVKNVILKVSPPDRALSGVLRNNGHAPTLSLSNDVSVKLFGGGLDSTYFLKQLHFHFGCDDSTGSEHQIDGQVSPLELHLVFWDNETFVTFPEAAKGDRGIVVLAVLFQRAYVSAVETKGTPLAKFVQLLRKIEEEGDDVKVSEVFDLRLEKLIPNVMNPEQADKFFVYQGSLSTPGCYESVTWIVYDTHPVVTDGQLEVFRTLRSSKVNQLGTMCNNYRPVQKFNGRRVYSNII